MLKIHNGDRVLTVTKGAFREIYSPLGWVVMNEGSSLASQESTVAPEQAKDSKPITSQENSTDTPYTASEDHPVNGQNQEASEEVTLESMNKMELVQYASLLGIDTKPLKTVSSLREAIRKHQN